MTTLESICEGHDVSDTRKETIGKAIALGADEAALIALREAVRVYRGPTIVLPPHRFALLSRGRGYARLGKGKDVVWGDRVDSGYQVGPGRWLVGGNDGFKRKGETSWVVEHLTIGAETWTVAS